MHPRLRRGSREAENVGRLLQLNLDGKLDLKVNGGKFLLEPIDPNVATDPVLIAGLFASLLFSPRACTRLYLVEIAYVTISNER